MHIPTVFQMGVLDMRPDPYIRFDLKLITT